MRLYYDEDCSVSPALLQLMDKAAARVLATEDLDADAFAVSVSFVDLEEIHRLNRDYRGVDRPTDVLSFPQYEGIEEIREEAAWCDAEEPLELGDVVICLDKAREQAAEYGHSEERETIYLFVHSVLHLLGYDHMEEDEKKVMRDREEEVMEWLGIGRESAAVSEAAPAAEPETDPAADSVVSSAALYRMAASAMDRAYAPYSNYRVGAALLAEDGRVFTGVNVENASYGGTICAERTACVKAVSEGATSFRKIAVTCSEGRATMCGICRQFLSEFGTDLVVITGEDEEHLTETTLAALLPEDFQLAR